MQNIPNISKKFKSSKDYKKLKAELQTTKTKSGNCLQNIKNILNEVDTLSTSEINKLQRIKTTIIAHLNKREEELLLEIKESRDQDTAA